MSPDTLPDPFNRIKIKFQINHELELGDTLFIQNDVAAGLFYLVSGSISLTRTTKGGHNVLIHRARAGETFAEASLYTEKYHCTAKATMQSRIIECHRDAITDLLATDAEFARAIAARFATQVQTGRRHVELLSIRAADERILAALSDGLLVDDITHFADYIGIAPETAYRTLALLCKNGSVLKSERGKYQIAINR